MKSIKNPAPYWAGFFYGAFPYSWALFPKFTPQTNDFLHD